MKQTAASNCHSLSVLLLRIREEGVNKITEGKRIACRLLTLIYLDKERLLLFILPFLPPPLLPPAIEQTRRLSERLC